MEQCNIVLVLRTGGDFKFRDVELLAKHLHLQWKSDVPLKVYCLYDKVEVRQDLVNITLLPMENHWIGWWAKLNLFSPGLINLRPFLYMDLDTAVLGDISKLFNIGEKVGFVGLQDFVRANQFASGVMFFPEKSNSVDSVWETWISNPYKFIDKFRGDQNFISNFIHSRNYWQEHTSMICSFKIREGDRSWLREVPDTISVVCFHGKPRVFDAANQVEWVKNYVQV